MAGCDKCKKSKKFNPPNILTGVKDNKKLQFISSKNGKIATFSVLCLFWPLIALVLPLLFYWAIFGLPLFNKKEDEQHQDQNNPEWAGQIS